MRRSPVDGVTGDVHRRHTVDDPLRHDISDAATHQDAQRVHPGRHEVSVQFGRRPQHRPDIGGEGFRPTEKQPDADLRQRRDALQSRAQVRSDPVPIRRHGAEREAVRHAIQ